MNSPVKNWRDIKKISKSLNKKGKLLLWTKIFAAPSGFEHEAPYYCGIVEFEDGKRLSVQIVDVSDEELKIGLEVETVVRRMGSFEAKSVIDYNMKVRPAQVYEKKH